MTFTGKYCKMVLLLKGVQTFGRKEYHLQIPASRVEKVLNPPKYTPQAVIFLGHFLIEKPKKDLYETSNKRFRICGILDRSLRRP